MQGLLEVLDSVLEAPFGLDVIQDLLKLLIFKSTLQTEHTHTDTDADTEVHRLEFPELYS